MNDDISKRMKENYENRYRFYFPRRTYTILRIDGKNFSKYTRYCVKPFDAILHDTFKETTKFLMEEIQGCYFAYTQSDEISLILKDFSEENINTGAWFDGNIQKMVSVAASFATGTFNRRALLNCIAGFGLIGTKGKEIEMAAFDCRAFIIPDPIEVYNYIIWRWQDCSRNSVSMLAQSMFSHKELHGKSCKEMQEMIFTKSGQNWSQLEEWKKNGAVFYKKEREIICEEGWKFTEDEKLKEILL